MTPSRPRSTTTKTPKPTPKPKNPRACSGVESGRSLATTVRGIELGRISAFFAQLRSMEPSLYRRSFSRKTTPIS